MSGPTYAISLGTLGSPGNSPGTEALSDNRLYPRSTATSAIFQVTDKPVLLRAFGLPNGAVLSLEMVLGDGTAFQAAPFVLAGITYTLTPTNSVLAVSVEGRYRLVLTGAAPTAIIVTATQVGLDYDNLSMARQGAAAGGILIGGLTPATLPVTGADLMAVSQAGSTMRRLSLADLSSFILASPALTGTPTAPTAAADTNTTQIATTAYVTGQAGTTTPTMNGVAAVGTSLRYSRQDHVHPRDTGVLPLTGGGTVVGDVTVTGQLSGLVTATGSTAPRSLAARFGQVLDARDQGATGDGTTNDKPAIDALITSLPAAGGMGQAHVSKGTYSIPAKPSAQGKDFAFTLDYGAKLTGTNPWPDGLMVRPQKVWRFPTFGHGDTATAFSMIANYPHNAYGTVDGEPMAGLTGGSGQNSQIYEGYPSFDAAAVFVKIFPPPFQERTSGTTFTASSFSVTTPLDTSMLRVGMQVVAAGTSTWRTRILSWNDAGTTVTVEPWYRLGSGTPGTPNSGAVVGVNTTTKIFGINVETELRTTFPYCTESAVAEYSVRQQDDYNPATGAWKSWGVDVINLSPAGGGPNTRAGQAFIARGRWWETFTSEGAEYAAFVAKPNTAGHNPISFLSEQGGTGSPFVARSGPTGTVFFDVGNGAFRGSARLGGAAVGADTAVAGLLNLHSGVGTEEIALAASSRTLLASYGGGKLLRLNTADAVSSGYLDVIAAASAARVEVRARRNSDDAAIPLRFFGSAAEFMATADFRHGTFTASRSIILQDGGIIAGDRAGSVNDILINGADNVVQLRPAVSGGELHIRLFGGTATALIVSPFDADNPVYLRVNGSTKNVTQGATDSGGTGFRALRVPN